MPHHGLLFTTGFSHVLENFQTVSVIQFAEEVNDKSLTGVEGKLSVSKHTWIPLCLGQVRSWRSCRVSPSHFGGPQSSGGGVYKKERKKEKKRTEKKAK